MIYIYCNDCGRDVLGYHDPDKTNERDGYTYHRHDMDPSGADNGIVGNCPSSGAWIATADLQHPPKDAQTEAEEEAKRAAEKYEKDKYEVSFPETKSVSQVANEVMDRLVDKGQLSPAAADEFRDMVGRSQPLLDLVMPETLDRMMGQSFDHYSKYGLGVHLPARFPKPGPVVDGLGEMQADITDFMVDEDGVREATDEDIKESLRNIPDHILDQIFEERGMYNTPLVVDLQRLLNKHSAEISSNTPDYVLAEYLMTCLEAFNKGVLARAVYYGDDQHIGGE